MADSLSELTRLIRDFSVARDWLGYQNPKNLVLALTGEVGELAAELQWLRPEEAEAGALSTEQHAAIEGELADVAIYLLRLADRLEIDLGAAIARKMAVNEGRFARERRSTESE